ncbi:MAG TPA: sulfotransferase [Pirellulales bacterium]|nr:sulfotransferase [Pirellulales bacterium]
MSSPTPGLSAEFAALVRLAEGERQAGRLAAAAAAYRRLLAQRPDFAAGHRDLGFVLARDGQLDEALVALRQAVSLEPGLVDARNELGNVLRRQGRLEEALGHYEQALALRPDLAELHYNVGVVQQALGRLEAAVERYRHAARLRPDLADVHNNLGNTLKQLGDFPEALACYDRTLALGTHVAEAHHNRADLKKFRRGDADLAALERLAADTGRLEPGKAKYVHFALAKALEDIGDDERAFDQLLLANRLKRSEISYEPATTENAVQRIAGTIDAALLDRLAGAGDRSPRPIFILGMPRSGSTLVEQIVASHPQVQAGGELLELDRLARSIRADQGLPRPYPDFVPEVDADFLTRFGAAYLASLPPAEPGKTRLTDKAPGNFSYVGLIRLVLPAARIIHTVRDPVDTCVSCFSKLFTGQDFSYDLAELGHYYRQYATLMAHWRAVLPAGAMLEVAYEEIVGDLETQARRLIEFCGLEWDERCLAFHQTNRPIATASKVQVRQPIYRGSLGRWRRYEAQLAPLLAELGRLEA